MSIFVNNIYDNEMNLTGGNYVNGMCTDFPCVCHQIHKTRYSYDVILCALSVIPCCCLGYFKYSIYIHFAPHKNVFLLIS